MVLRDILQFSDSIEDAIGFAQSITRTWAIFIALGDFASQQTLYRHLQRGVVPRQGPAGL